MRPVVSLGPQPGGLSQNFLHPGAKVPVLSEKHSLSRGPDSCGHDGDILFLQPDVRGRQVRTKQRVGLAQNKGGK